MLDFVKTPTLLVMTHRVERNIERMKAKADRSGVRFRPHFKTHQSGEMGEYFRKAGVEAITVSSVSMARFFASRGWGDITIAFPVNLREMDDIRALAQDLARASPRAGDATGARAGDATGARAGGAARKPALRAAHADAPAPKEPPTGGQFRTDAPALNLVVESVESARALGRAFSAGGGSGSGGSGGGPAVEAGVYLKIDAGYGRTGIPAGDDGAAAAVARELTRSPGLKLRGLLAHAGHTYSAPSAEAVRGIFRETVEALGALKGRLAERGFRDLEISVGDTPGCSILDRFDGVDEVRPGNFVFYDAKQLGLGSCREEDIAAAVACPVVARHPERGQVLIYGGAVHLSKDFHTDPEGRRVCGLVALPAPEGWGPVKPRCRVSSVSQEHGVVTVDPETMAELSVGDLLVVIPSHICLAVDLLGEYHSPRGELLGTVWRRSLP